MVVYGRRVGPDNQYLRMRYTIIIDDPKVRDLVDELQVELARLVVHAMGLSESH